MSPIVFPEEIVTHPGDRGHSTSLHPLHAMLLAFPLALFIGALLCDIAYWSSYQIQWANFAAWLNAGGLVFGTAVVVLATIGLARRSHRGKPLLYFLLLVTMWVLGFINALVHGRDAWASMPAGLYLSAVVAALASGAAFIGYSGFRSEAKR